MMGPYNLIERTLGKVAKIYLYNFTNYFCKRVPRDFQFTPLVVDAEHRNDYLLERYKWDRSLLEDSDYRTAGILWKASGEIPCTAEWWHLYDKWKKWLKYGGLNWLRRGGPKPSGLRINHNSKKYSWQRKKFFESMQSWEEEQFIKRGDPATEATGPRESFSGPGISEICFMKLEIHSEVYGQSA